jgi:hypothetical protein
VKSRLEVKKQTQSLNESIVNQWEFYGQYEDYLPILMKHAEINVHMKGPNWKHQKTTRGLGGVDENEPTQEMRSWSKET